MRPVIFTDMFQHVLLGLPLLIFGVSAQLDPLSRYGRKQDANHAMILFICFIDNSLAS
jgi:hypothetical protein